MQLASKVRQFLPAAAAAARASAELEFARGAGPSAFSSAAAPISAIVTAAGPTAAIGGLLLRGSCCSGARCFWASWAAAGEESGGGSSPRGNAGNRSDQEQSPPPGAWSPQPASGGLRDDPGHELATGGLYESARKDREAVPSPWPGTTKEELQEGGARPSAQQVTRDSGGGAGDLPASSYPIHDDPSTSMQHPDEAFRGPSAEAYGRPQQRGSQPPPADQPKEAEPSPGADVPASPGQMGATRDPPPEDVKQGQVGAVQPPSKQQRRSEAEGFVRSAVADDLKEPARGKLDERADWAQSDRH
ncbi:hypothetical protein HYH02_008404 [Chlamydomonas schloesseri]|uniref:Uncharacterized protein n=1 Tax=Chlamydomonas schloesseri TaxID=2026947 RepID=A0A835WFC8_9CHLO|nr:hypothetical protein HYH02_008404 [Chlamydomonas schloesseri]|eukprot:KAG2446410.1 hypothetical protein HYH02_008404 [Chlamydomonas schloesseri]